MREVAKWQSVTLGKYVNKKTGQKAEVCVHMYTVFPNRTGSNAVLITDDGWSRNVYEAEDLKDWELTEAKLRSPSRGPRYKR